MMNIKTTVRTAVLAAMAASALAVCTGPATAQASLLPACSGSNIHGEGGSAQTTAQGVWTSRFNTNTNGGCTTGSFPIASYATTGSYACEGRWNVDGTGFDTSVHFCGTDAAPTAGQLATMNSALGGASVLTLPVAQYAVAIVVNPPAGCTLYSVSPAELEQVLRGAITSWGGLADQTGCSTSSPINRVVSSDPAGDTYQLKHYLFTRNSAAVTLGRTWADLQSPAYIGTWPGGAVTTAGVGDADEVRAVKATVGTFGYASLAVARSQYTGTDNYTWVPVGASASPVDPSSNGPSRTAGRSNCSTATNAYGSLPSATASWAGVYQTTPGTTGYPICALTWDLAVSDYSRTWGAAGQARATTVHDYLTYVLTTAGGANDALNVATRDYQKLPTDLQTAAQGGIAQITD